MCVMIRMGKRMSLWINVSMRKNRSTSTEMSIGKKKRMGKRMSMIMRMVISMSIAMTGRMSMKMCKRMMVRMTITIRISAGRG